MEIASPLSVEDLVATAVIYFRSSPNYTRWLIYWSTLFIGIGGGVALLGIRYSAHTFLGSVLVLVVLVLVGIGATKDKAYLARYSDTIRKKWRRQNGNEPH